MSCRFLVVSWSLLGLIVCCEGRAIGCDRFNLSEVPGSFEISYVTRDKPDLRSSHLVAHENGPGQLVAAGDGFAVTFSVQPRGTYLALRMTDVVEPAPGSLMTLRYRLEPDSGFALTRLDYMTKPSEDGLVWPWLWARNSPNPLGGFAIQKPLDDADFDDCLLQIWVAEGLPHPKVEGEWTVARARKWLTAWQARFSDQSTLVIGAANRKELDQMTGWARDLGMKRVYLHTDTWRGEYWPRQYSYLRVNPLVFPNGESDLNDYTQSLRDRGMSFALHSTCLSIGPNDPDYVRDGVDPRLSRWVRGSLAEAVDATATTVRFRPGCGERYPRMIKHAWAGPNTMRTWMGLEMFLVEDELLIAGAIDHSNPELWVLKDCQRGAWGKDAKAHAAGATCQGMLRAYRQVFVPDPDSTLFDETIRRWAAFCSRNNVDHLECDALEDHADKPWGVGKLSWLLSSELTLPSTSNTSSGRPLPFQVEYWFRGSQKVMANHARAGVAGGASLPLFLHEEIRVATGPYELLFKPAEMVGGGGGSFNVSYPWPMFGVTPRVLKQHGLVPVVERLITNWRRTLPQISQQVRDAIRAEYGEFRSPLGKARNQRGTDVLFRPEVVDGKSWIIPLRLLGRSSGELNWGYGQEFGPIVPRQYLRAGGSLHLRNPWSEQEPEFVIRVMGKLEEAAGEWVEATSANDGAEDAAILAAYEAGTATEFAVHPLHSARHIWAADAVKNGEAEAGSVELRCEFAISNLADVESARLYLQVDDEAVAFLNGKKVLSGGRFDKLEFVALTGLREGQNELLIRARNGGGPGALAGGLQIREKGVGRMLPTNGSWQARKENGTWGAVADLGAYGGNVWPEVQPQPALIHRDLMPGGSTIEQVPGHTLVATEEGLAISASNRDDGVAVHLEDRPSWETNLDMSHARGVGCTVTGDGSGAVLVITIEGHGHRDYVVPIDFSGTREIQIPTGEVAWATPSWSWRGHGRFNYERLRRVRVGFGTVPAKTEARVLVQNMRPLREDAGEMREFTIRVGAERELVVAEPVRSGEYLWYRGGDTIEVYDLNWNKLRDCEVRKQTFSCPTGEFALTFSKTAGDRLWLETQVFVRGTPLAADETKPIVGGGD